MAAASGPNIVEDGLVFALDAGNTKSYDSSSLSTITYVGGTSDSDNSSSFTLSGLQSGDLVLYFSAEDTANVNTPTGASWTAVPGLTTQPDNDQNPSSSAFYVFATGTSVTASGLATGDNHVRVMIAFRNVNSTNPFDVNATENSASSGLPNPPSITPVTNNSMIVAVGLLDDEDVANSISPPTGYTTAVMMDSQGGADSALLGGATIMTAYKLLATAAAEDPATFTSSNASAGDPNKGISIALRPGPSLTWTDLSGKGNNGTLTDGPTYSSDNGGSIVFDGTNDYINFGSVSDANFGTGDFAVECWFFDDGNTPDYAGLVVNGQSGGNDNSAFQFGKGGNAGGEGHTGRIEFTRGTSSDANTLYDSTNTIQSNTWTHAIATRIGTTVKLYINGVEVDSMTDSGSYSNTALRLGINRGGSVYWSGEISNVRIYKGKGLTASEIQQNYNALKGRYIN